MPLIIDEGEVARLLSMDAALVSVEAVVKDHACGRASNLPRRRLFAGTTSLHLMAGASHATCHYGVKIYSTSKTGARFLVLLFDAASGDLNAIIEADRLGQIRTGAASGIATKYMAAKSADTLGIIGSGWQAESQLAAICRVRPIRSIKVFSRDVDRRRAFAMKMSPAVGLAVTPVETAREAVEGSSIVVTATTSRVPVLEGKWLEPGAHLNAIGANYLSKSEIDVDAVGRASVVAVDSIDQARAEAGDLLPAIERGIIHWESVQEIGRIVSGQVPGRLNETDITLFKSSGVGIWDVAVAERVYAMAKTEKCGRWVDFWSQRDSSR